MTEEANVGPGCMVSRTFDVPPSRVPVSRSHRHIPCLAEESVTVLLGPNHKCNDGSYDGTYVDCTFGRGGHSREILSRLNRRGRLFAFDVDPSAVEVGRVLEQEDSRFHIFHRPFADIGTVLAGEKLSGVLLDLGVSSPQLDDVHRGFNITENASLDLRMNPGSGMSAAEWLETATVEEMAWVISQYGEDSDEIMAERIAQAIDQERRRNGPIRWTRQLANVVRWAKGDHDERGQHPAKLTFQAFRVFLNHEMKQLDEALKSIVALLEFGGTCAVIAFKFKESEAVRKMTREHEEPDEAMLQRLPPERLCELFPLMRTDKDYAVRQAREPIRPSQGEVYRNPRSRSSMLHVIKKVPRCAPMMIHAAAGVRAKHERFVKPVMPPLVPGVPSARSSGLSSWRDWEREGAARRGRLADIGSFAKATSHILPHEGWGDTISTSAGSSGDTLPHESLTILYTVVVLHNIQGDAEGYLTLKKGDLLRILYHGSEGDEVDWLYGVQMDTCGKVQQGWVAAAVCDRIEDAQPVSSPQLGFQEFRADPLMDSPSVLLDPFRDMCAPQADCRWKAYSAAIYILDALNILKHRNNETDHPELDWSQLMTAGEYYKRKGKQVFAFLQRTREWRPWDTEIKLLSHKLGEDFIVRCPPGASDDEFMITYAREREAQGQDQQVKVYIVTNNLFRDHGHVDEPWVRQHTVKYAFAGGWFVPQSQALRTA